MSISAVNTASQTTYSAPTQTVSSNAKAADGDYKAPGAGRAKDTDGDFKPITYASAPQTTNSVLAALSNLRTGG